MNWKLFIAHRLYKDNEGGREVSKPAIHIAVAGIAIGLAVMIVSVAVVLGFKHQVRDKVVGMGSDILVNNVTGTQIYQMEAVAVTDSLTDALRAQPMVKHVQRYSTKPGMIMTADNFQGMLLKGVGPEYDMSYLQAHLLEGEIPVFSDSVSSNRVLISKTLADKLKLRLADKVNAYFLEDNVRARRLTVCGIYQTNFTYFDDLFLIGDLYTVNRLNGWEQDEVAGLEIACDDFTQIDRVNDSVRSVIEMYFDRESRILCSRTVVDVYPQIFAWLDLLDLNVWVILILMLGVAGFTMISGLLIIILERTNLIGVLKALGADNTSVRRIFLLFAVYLIGRGMLIGNVVALTFCGVQYFLRPLTLDPAVYYINAVPIEFSWGLFVLLNVCTMLVSVLMLVGPSYLISRIHPATSMRFE